MADVTVRLLSRWTCTGCQQCFVGVHEAVVMFAEQHVTVAEDVAGGHWSTASLRAGKRVMAGEFGTQLEVKIDSTAIQTYEGETRLAMVGW